MKKVNEPNIFSKIQAKSLSIAASGVAALQAMKYEIFTFHDDVRMILGWVISIITIGAIWISGHELTKTIKEGKDVLGKLKDIRSKEQDKQEKEDGKI